MGIIDESRASGASLAHAESLTSPYFCFLKFSTSWIVKRDSLGSLFSSDFHKSASQNQTKSYRQTFSNLSQASLQDYQKMVTLSYPYLLYVLVFRSRYILQGVSAICYNILGQDRNLLPSDGPNEYQPCNAGDEFSMCCGVNQTYPRIACVLTQVPRNYGAKAAQIQVGRARAVQKSVLLEWVSRPLCVG